MIVNFKWTKKGFGKIVYSSGDIYKSEWIDD